MFDASSAIAIFSYTFALAIFAYRKLLYIRILSPSRADSLHLWLHSQAEAFFACPYHLGRGFCSKIRSCGLFVPAESQIL
jgi:hypothetical protein